MGRRGRFYGGRRMTSLSNIRNIVKGILQDDSDILQNNEIDACISNAITIHNQNYPIETIGDLDGDGSAYDFSFPTGWVADFSKIRKVEYPAGNRNPDYLEHGAQWILYDNGVEEKFRMVLSTPASGETVRLTFTVPYVITTIKNLPQEHIRPFAYLAAALCCEPIAAHYSQCTDTSIHLDVAEYGDKDEKWHTLSKTYRKKYLEGMGGGTDKENLKAAGARINWDRKNKYNEDPLHFPQSTR